MAVYTHAYVNKTLSTSDDTATMITTATGVGSVIRVEEFFIGGEASSSTATRVVINRPGSVGVTPTTQALQKLDPASATATFTVATTWSTQPVHAAQHVLAISFNAFGGVVRWVAQPDRPIVVGGQGAVANLSFRGASGTPVISGYFQIEEK